MKKTNLLYALIIVFAVILSFLTVLLFYNPFDIPKAEIQEKTDTGENTDTVPEIIYKREPVKISFLAAGDSIVHSSVYNDAKLLAKDTDEQFNFVPMFSEVRDIVSSYDLAFVNQETPCAGPSYAYSGYPMFNTPDEISDALIDTGFDIVNISNNHMLDKGSKGLERTVKFWNAKDDICLVGCSEKENRSDNIKYYVKDGVKIAFLAYTYSTNGLVMSSSSNVEFYYLNKDEIDRQTKIARKTADVVIVSMHWGVEDMFVPNEEQLQLADLLTENGVDVVIGSHPHVIQTIEWKENSSGHKTLVAYSIGNMLSTMLYSRNMLGGFLTFDILEDTQNNSFYIDNAGFIPTVTYYNMSRRGLKIYPLSQYTPEMHKLAGTHANENGKDINFLYGIVKKHIPREFLKEDFYNSVF